MPLNSSVPLLYYNKTAFKAAGLDPDKPPQNLAEIRAAAEKLSKVNGGPVAYGFGAAIYGWFLEQFAATNGEEFCNADNGRTGQRVTAANMASPTITEAVEWWQKMVADGLAVNTGRVTKDAQDAFKAGQTAMTLESTGQVKGFTTAAKGKFELGAAPYPVVSGTEKPGNGPSIGGGSLWISGPGHSEAEKEASWQLAKFLAQPDSQAVWHTQTGYFPVTSKALDEPVDKEFVAANPLFTVAIDSLNKTKVSPATTGCAAGPMPQMRKALEDGLERALIGKDARTLAGQGPGERGRVGRQLQRVGRRLSRRAGERSAARRRPRSACGRVKPDDARGIPAATTRRRGGVGRPSASRKVVAVRHARSPVPPTLARAVRPQ